MSGALVEVGRVEPRVAHADEHLAAAGLGVGTVLQVDDLAAADTREDDASQGGEPYLCRADRIRIDRARRGASGSLYRQAALAGLNSHLRGPARRHQGRLLRR